MTAFVCSDIHSFYDEWMGALNTQGFNIKNDNHILVVLGDLLDRGPKSQECLDFVNNLPENRKILIKGNHEDLIERVIARGGFYMHDFHNGTVKTISDLTGVEYGECVYNPLQVINELSKNESLYKYLNSCVDYFENKNLMVHISEDSAHNSPQEILEYREKTVAELEERKKRGEIVPWNGNTLSLYKYIVSRTANFEDFQLEIFLEKKTIIRFILQYII